MSSLVHGDPEAIRAFAQLLNQFCDEVRERLGGVSAHLNEMATSAWSDAQYHAYVEQFDTAAAQLHRTLAEIQPEHVTHLHRKAQELEDYQNQ